MEIKAGRRRREPIATGQERLAARLAAKAAAEFESGGLTAEPIEQFAPPEDILARQHVVRA